MYSILQHLAYNSWANRKVGSFILNAPESLFDEEVKSSMTSLRQTVYHIWDAEFIWMRRIQGESLHDWPSKNFNGTRDETIAAWTEGSEILEDFVKNQEFSFGSVIVSYRNLKGDLFQNSVEQIIMHVVNHSTFHRGQIVTILRGLGYTDLASSDLITYLRL